MKTVDAHLHLFRSCSKDYPRTVYPILAEADREELSEKLLGEMEIAGIDHAIVVPLSRNDEYLQDVLRDHPGKFAGVSFFDHEQPDNVTSLKARMLETKFQGLRFYGLGAEVSTDPRSLGVFKIMQFMAANNLVVWFYGDDLQLRALDVILNEIPDLKVVMNHLGFLPNINSEMKVDEHRRPRFNVTLPPRGLNIVEDCAARHKNLHVHFSGHYAFSKEAYPYMDLKGVVERLLEAFGAKRMMMASDWPWIQIEPGYKETLSIVDKLLPNLKPAERDFIRGGTALSLFDFSAR